jgi:PilZ domain
VGTWHPRARRYPFAATTELTDLQFETQLVERTTDLSLYGCCVRTQRPFVIGTKVRVKIVHGGANFVALGRVVYVGPEDEMGITFTEIEKSHQSVLDKWIFEEREHS